MSVAATWPSSARSIARAGLVIGGVVGLLALAALILRTSQIGQSLLGDESFTFQDIHGRSFLAVLRTVHTGGENSPPLFFLFAWTTAKLGDVTKLIRLPSILFGAATVPVLFLLGRETVGRTAACLGSAMYAIGPFTVYYGTEARAYATMAFFVALSSLAVVRIARGGTRWWWAVYVLAADAAAYTHYTAIFVLVVQGAWLTWHCKERLRAPLSANAAAVLLYVPWLPHLRGKELVVIGLLYPLRVGSVLKDLVRVLVGYPSAGLRGIPTIAGLVAIAIPVSVAIVIAGRRWWQGPRRALPALGSPSTLLALQALATPVGLLLYSLLVTDLWLPRNLSASLPAALLMFGALLTALPGRALMIGAGIVLATLAGGTLRSFRPDYRREPYREMAAYLDRVATPTEPVIMDTLIGGPAIAAQAHKPHRFVSQPTAATWSEAAPGAHVYVVLDDRLAQLLGISRLDGPAHPAGFAVVARRHYRGSLPTDVLTYRRS